MKQQEIWKDIVGYEGLYQVSNFGNVKSLPRHRVVGWADYISKEKILKQSEHRQGYKYVWLHKNKKKKIFKIHRLVAEAFIPNPHNFQCINHKDENKANNFVENLEWCNHSYNNNYGTRNEKVRKANCKIVLQYSIEGKFIKKWNGTREAARVFGISCTRISEVCRGKRKSVGNFIWKYEQ